MTARKYTKWEKNMEIRISKIETELKLHKWYYTVIVPSVTAGLLFLLNHVLHIINV